MQLKISSITNLTDARFFSAIGAHYLGFCLDVLNEYNISIPKAKEIINLVKLLNTLTMAKQPIEPLEKELDELVIQVFGIKDASPMD